MAFTFDECVNGQQFVANRQLTTFVNALVACEGLGEGSTLVPIEEDTFGRLQAFQAVVSLGSALVGLQKTNNGDLPSDVRNLDDSPNEFVGGPDVTKGEFPWQNGEPNNRQSACIILSDTTSLLADARCEATSTFASVCINSCVPTASPTASPVVPTSSPTEGPTKHPTKAPTNLPTLTPTRLPTTSPNIASSETFSIFIPDSLFMPLIAGVSVLLLATLGYAYLLKKNLKKIKEIISNFHSRRTARDEEVEPVLLRSASAAATIVTDVTGLL